MNFAGMWLRDIYLNKERALKAGAKAFVQKPWNDKELLAIIRLVRGPTRAFFVFNPRKISHAAGFKPVK